jgi:hypothetical protein
LWDAVPFSVTASTEVCFIHSKSYLARKHLGCQSQLEVFCGLTAGLTD